MTKGQVGQSLIANKTGVPVNHVFGASVTAIQVGKVFQVTSGGSLSIRIDLVADTVTAGAGITWKLQSMSGVDKDGADNWIDASGTVDITAAGSTTLALNVQNTASDEQYLPLRPTARIVITTGAGSAVTVEQLNITQAQ